MIIIPAIDIKDGKCVRLLRGDYSTVHQVADDAIQTACSFHDAGAEWLHVVDLDGAKDAKPYNSDLIFKILKASGLKVEVGGGIRNMGTIDFYLNNGISRVILGTAAINKPELVLEAIEKYGKRVAVGIDAKNGMVAQKGWTETSSIDYLGMAKYMEQAGVKNIIFTDISRDGTLSGPNLKMLDAINNAVSCNIVASGGVGNLKDIANLLDLNLYGAICGKSIYSGTLDLKSAIEICRRGKSNE